MKKAPDAKQRAGFILGEIEEMLSVFTEKEAAIVYEILKRAKENWKAKNILLQ